MFLKIITSSDEIVKKAQEYFPNEYIEGLEGKPFHHESLLARYVISKHIGKGYLPEIDETGVPQFQNTSRWSLSHKKSVVFIGVHTSDIGVDIEEVKQRDTSVFESFIADDYIKLGEKNWKNFYILWTSHESIIKFTREIKYKTGMYTLTSYKQKLQTISGIDFAWELEFCKGEKNYTIVSGEQGGYIYSLCK